MGKDVFKFLSTNGYTIERVPRGDKHANGIAERQVGLIEEMTNVAMLAVIPPVPQAFWDFAMVYASDTRNFNFCKSINSSPYKFETNNDVDIRKLHGFWDKCWIQIPVVKRDGKVGSPRASKGRFLGYHLQQVQYELYYILNLTEKGHYGSISLSKEVLFDNNISHQVDY